ncbi:MAG: cupredoxin domain-containing protein [Thermomicrobiales bacterium]
MRHRIIPLLGIVTLCIFLAACGGSAASTATIAAPTRAAATTPAAPAATTAPASAATSSATSAPAASVAPATPATSATIAPGAGGGNAVAVELKDYAITLSTSTVSAGMVTFTIKNNGPSAHNFNVQANGEEKGVTTLDPGTTKTLTLDLKAGSYVFRCNIPGHDLLGMKGMLTVK